MLVHDRAPPLARRRTPEGFLEMRASIKDDRVGSATTSRLVAELQAAIRMRDHEIAKLKAYAAAAPCHEAVENRNDAGGAAAIEPLTGLPSTRRSDPSLSLIALQARNDAISNAWKPGVAKVGTPATTVTRSWHDSEPAVYLTQPRDEDGRWTTAGASSFTKGSDVDTSSSTRASLINGYKPSTIPSSSTRSQIAYPDGWQACHERCLEETDHIRGPERPAIYRKCGRKCLGPDADY